MYCCTPKALYSHVGGGGDLLNHHQCAASTWMVRRLPHDNGASALTTHQLQVERRERWSQSSGWRLLGGHDWRGLVVGIWSGQKKTCKKLNLCAGNTKHKVVCFFFMLTLKIIVNILTLDDGESYIYTTLYIWYILWPKPHIAGCISR